MISAGAKISASERCPKRPLFVTASARLVSGDRRAAAYPGQVTVSEAWRALGGRRRTLARVVYARDRADPGYVCPRCDQPIDWDLPYKDTDGQVDVMSRSVDHLQETQDGGALTDLDNLASVHLGCNSSKGAERRHERERESRPPSGTIIIDPSTL